MDTSRRRRALQRVGPLLVLASLLGVSNEQVSRGRSRRRRSVWVKQWRQKLLHPCILNDLQFDREDYRGYLRMDAAVFGDLLSRVKPLIEKEDTRFRKCVPAEERLSITLCYLATGSSKSFLHYHHRLGKSTVHTIIDECLAALLVVLKDQIKAPSTTEAWQAVIDEFFHRWNMPNTFGAVDGKHVHMQAPPNSGSHFFNYKNRHSLVLMAVADARLRFMYVDIGCQGRVSDGGVWANCSFKQALDNNSLSIPSSGPLPGTQVQAPNVLVADDAFPLSANLLKPYSGTGTQLSMRQLIFNYRLSRARRVIESAFGILVARFRIFKTDIAVSVQRIKILTKVCCCLHNLLTNQSSYIRSSDLDQEDLLSGLVVPASWRNESSTFQPLANRGGRPTTEGTMARELFTNYVNDAAPLDFQDNMVAGL